MQKLMELRGITIKSFTLGMPEFEERVDNATKQACKIITFNGVVDFFYKDRYIIEKEGPVTLFYYRFFWPFRVRPVVVLGLTSKEADYDTLGVSILHELIHVQQGLWRIIKETIIGFFKKAWSDFPPFEEEALELSTNLWWDQKQVEVK